MANHQHRLQYFLLLLFLFINYFSRAQQLGGGGGQQHEAAAPVDINKVQVINKILIPNLPPDHYRFWLRNHPKAFQEFTQICSRVAASPQDLADRRYFVSLHANVFLEDQRYLLDFNYGRSVLFAICSKIDLVTKSCWGYENNCQMIYLMPECHPTKLVATKNANQVEQEQKVAWFGQADFGYILGQRRELSKYCSPNLVPNRSDISSFECTRNFKTCRGQNLYMKFEDVIPKINKDAHFADSFEVKRGNVGGWDCDLQLKRIAEEGAQEGALKSWFKELKNYEKLIGTKETSCDITINKQAFIIKLDEPSDMYRYFSNFLNLYATLHLNNKFSTDNELIIWDNHLPRSKYELMWYAFSRNPPRHIGEFQGKRVCFDKFIFPLLPQTVDGLYHNTTARLVEGCSKTGLFHAFSKHILHRLEIFHGYDLEFYKKTNNQIISVTIIRRSSPQRRILNELELEKALKAKSNDFIVRLIDFSQATFHKQLQLTQSSDILVGLHGSDLTNLLFLPDWAALVELHDCGDLRYHNLAKLRGINYFNSQSEDNFFEKFTIGGRKEANDTSSSSTLVDEDKMSNYQINIEKFVDLVVKAADVVKENRLKILREFEQASRPQPPAQADSGAKIETKKPAEHHEEL